MRHRRVVQLETSWKESGKWSRYKSRVRSYNCGIYGHYAGECHKPKREKDQKSEQSPEVNMAKIEDDEPALLFTKCENQREGMMLLNEEGVVPRLNQENSDRAESKLWYLDNGVSNHMTGQRSKFKELDEGVTGQVRFGDGSTMHIKGKGSVSFTYKNEEERILKEVYYIPMLFNNIIILGQLSEDGNKIVLSGEFLWVNDKLGKLILKVKRSPNRLYKILLETSKPKCLVVKSEEIPWLWHSRLGHVNFQVLTLMHITGMVHGLPKFTQPKSV